MSEESNDPVGLTAFHEAQKEAKRAQDILREVAAKVDACLAKTNVKHAGFRFRMMADPAGQLSVVLEFPKGVDVVFSGDNEASITISDVQAFSEFFRKVDQGFLGIGRKVQVLEQRLAAQTAQYNQLVANIREQAKAR